jgi:YHS domain-containing protein
MIEGNFIIFRIDALTPREQQILSLLVEGLSNKVIADRVLWLEDGEFKDVVEMGLDPVCGMSVDKESAPAQTVVDGRAFYFCARGCRDEFLSAPERFLSGQIS